MTREEMDFIGSMNMCDEISNEVYQKIMAHCEEQEPCEDCISRQAVLEWLKDKDIIKTKNQEENARRELAELPSVTPQPKVGEWLEKEVISDKVIEEWQSARCSVCDKYHTTPYMYYFSRYNYCPNCGAKMEEVAE